MPTHSVTVSNAEYRRTPSPQANRAGAVLAVLEVENFPFPGIMWHEKKNKENKNEKTPGYTTREEGKRSEEHTSELQSHLNLVCRLLLEKQKKLETSAAPTTS